MTERSAIRWWRRATFQLLRHRRNEPQAFLYAFALLELNGTDPRREPIETRKATHTDALLFRLLVTLLAARDLLLFAKQLFAAASTRHSSTKDKAGDVAAAGMSRAARAACVR